MEKKTRKRGNTGEHFAPRKENVSVYDLKHMIRLSECLTGALVCLPAAPQIQLFAGIGRWMAA